ncbi:uncharacterized protein PAC_19504 [Phialocephala subalpina]|uniref:Heterokaryon incompatibility domain-containing protein n=1 Tax=Phialocephala subalpina TaxID=576137 RepID=A0A1L7XX31_9HELO|nr:uncharacterized protein PAC_19504 [Phialocephala subalpina]
MSAVHERCYICTALLRYLDRRLGINVLATIPQGLQLLYGLNAHGSLYFRHKISDESMALSGDGTQQSLIQCIPISRDGQRTCEAGSCAMGKEDIMNRAFRWYRDCLDRHSACAGDIDEAFSPPRLLEVTNDSIRLVETLASHTYGGYATLSYCWGPNPSHLTLCDITYEDLYEGIRISDLPQTFRDATTIAKQFELKYLWIDSLCILQSGEGSSEDWQKHVRLMSSIYSNCMVNIAATHASNANGGLFSVRDTRDVEPCLIDLVTHKTPVSEGAQAGLETYVLVDRDLWHRTIVDSPLNSRGWVFQERLLAPRTIHFGKEQLFWECSELQPACETLPGTTLTSGWNLRPDDWEFHRPFVWNMNLEQSSKIHEFLGESTSETSYELQIWNFMVQAYSMTRLTYPEDKLPAIAGVAQRIAGVLQDDYAAGLFRKSLPNSLLWWSTNAKRACDYRAPSWSWASMDGQIHMYDNRQAHHRYPDHAIGPTFRYGSALSSVRDVTITLVDEKNPFGQIRAASLVLNGPSWQMMQSSRIKDDKIQVLHQGSPVEVGVSTRNLDNELIDKQDSKITLICITEYTWDIIIQFHGVKSFRIAQGLVLQEKWSASNLLEYVRVGTWESASLAKLLSTTTPTDVTII